MGKHGFFDRPTRAAQESLDRDMAAGRKARLQQEQARIAALSDSDIRRIMAGRIREAAAQRGEVSRRDFHQAGIPDARIGPNFEAAMALARRADAALDGMGATA